MNLLKTLIRQNRRFAGQTKFHVLASLVILSLSSVPTALAAQAKAETVSDGGMGGSPTTEIITLGTAGGPVLSKNRSEPATLLIVNGQYYLFDCGTGTVRQFLMAEKSPTDVRAIFITHQHPDHNLGLAEMVGNIAMEYAWSGADREWFILGPKGMEEMAAAAQRFYTVPYDVFYAEHLLGNVTSQAAQAAIAVTEIKADGVIFKDENIEVTAAQNSHFQLLDESVGTKSFSYRVKTPDAVVVITGDTGMSDAVIELSRDADILISESMNMTAIRKYIEAQAEKGIIAPDTVEPSMAHLRAGHLDLPEVGQIASSAGVNTILLTHFGPEANATTPDTIISTVRGAFEGSIFAAEDLDRYCVVPKGEGGGGRLKAC